MWNTDGKFQGKTDIPLSEKGREQAELLAARLEDIEIHRIYASPLKRAMETAIPLACKRGIDVIHREELKELDFGHWEGLTLDEVRQSFPDEFEKCRYEPAKYGFRFGLEYNDVKSTVRGFLNECIYKCDAENIAVVSHGAIIKMIILTLLDLPPSFLHSFRLDNCSVNIVRAGRGIYENKYILDTLNNTGSI